MSRSTKGQTLWRSLALFTALSLAVVACGGDGTGEDGGTTHHPPVDVTIVIPDLEDPSGEPLLPDLAPEPPVDLRTRAEGDRVTVRFSSTLVNVGDGDFVLRATRSGGEWVVKQEIWYSEGGTELITTDARMVWGGDGHDHWHIERVASYTLYRLDEDGEVIEDDIALPDAKVGFCFYDHSLVLEHGPEEAVYSGYGCGTEDDDAIRMGMSPGWADVYGFDLPGQSIDVTDLEDGFYRVVGVADPQNWFTEANDENNLTWIDIELITEGDLRMARLVDVGPTPADSR